LRILLVMWRPDQIADIAAAALQEHSDALRLEQAVRGLDALSEVELHPLLADGFAAAGFGVATEFPYPGQPTRRPRHAERERCDLVLTPSPEIAILDPVAELKHRDDAVGGLFDAEVVAAAYPGIPPEEAYWIEVKLVGQYCFNAGVPGPNRSYASELLTTAAADITKVSREPMIRHGSLLLVLFTADQPTASHDLTAFMHRCLDRDLPVQSPSQARFEVPDLIGNRLCTVAAVPIWPRI